MSERKEVEPDGDETVGRVRRNLVVLEEAMNYYRDYYWPFYRGYGFSFAEGWAAYKSDLSWDDDKEPWEQ